VEVADMSRRLGELTTTGGHSNMDDKVNLSDKVALLDEVWSPGIVGYLNDYKRRICW
jgi:hypothetical protein